MVFSKVGLPDDKSGSLTLFREGEMIRCVIFVILASLSLGNAMSFSAEPRGPAVYEQFPKAARPWLKSAYATELKRRTKAVGDAKSLLAKAKSDEAKDSAHALIADAKDELEALKANDPPFVGMRLEAWHGDDGDDSITLGPLEIGDIGVAAQPMRIVQITGPDSAILERKLQDKETMLIQLTGVSTKGWRDDIEGNIPGSLWVSGTTTYRTNAEGSHTVLVLEPFDWDRYRKTLPPK